MRIASLEQYIAEVKKIALSDNESAFPNVYFRGEANKEWKTEASLFRGRENEESYNKEVNYTKESDLIASALIQCPQVFEKCPNAISRLILMQHYGLPTRLYDVTANPLVALFFACNIELKEDGKVLFTKSDNIWSSQRVNILAELNEEFEKDDVPINLMQLYAYGKKKGIVSRDNNKEFFIWLFRNLTTSFLIQPPLDNERIKRQNGAMIFSALMKISNTKAFEKYLSLGKSDELTEEMINFTFKKGNINLRDMFREEEFIIKADDKTQIIRELDMVGINEAFLFPETEHQFRTIKSQNIPRVDSDWIEI